MRASVCDAKGVGTTVWRHGIVRSTRREKKWCLNTTCCGPSLVLCFVFGPHCIAQSDDTRNTKNNLYVYLVVM
jgi:hypothetical protein